MSLRFLRHVSRQFWDQYPIGTRLTWSFVFRQMGQNRNILSNTTKLFISLFLHFFMIWSVYAIPGAARLHRDVIYPPAPPGLASKAAYYAFAFPVAYALVGVCGVFFAAVTAAILVTLPVLAVAIIGSWALAVLLFFILWLGLYRWPVYEVVRPALLDWMLKHNAGAYSPLAPQAPAIRVVRLKAGRRDDRIECDLISRPLAEAEFEALSYVWGTGIVPYSIRVNDNPFYITCNLHRALQELRHDTDDRMLWIDAMCINQGDSAEKSTQVQMMRDIYAKAAKVVVWLGNSDKTTTSALELVRRFEGVDPDGEEGWWKDLEATPDWATTWKTFRSILEYEWWNRAWIIQEVVMGKDVVMQLGPYQTDWDQFSRLIACEAFEDYFRNFNTPLFVQDIRDLRSGSRSDEAISNTLLGLAYRFRFQSASFGSDKVYALLGLLKSDNPTLLAPDYSKHPDEVFLSFTLSCIKHNNNLTAIALAAGVELQDTSWCRDWRFNHDGQFNTMHFCTYPPPEGPDYSASGTQVPIFEADLSQRILSLKGYDMDVIARTGEFYQEPSLGPVDWLFAFQGWEHIAGGPWDDAPSQQAFHRTITGDSWDIEPLDWKPRIQRRGQPARDQEEERYLDIIDQVCQNRRFLVTKHGRFGLGPWNSRKGDKVCVLLGGKTPFLLRPCGPPRNDATGRDYYKVVGEAFVDGLMYYQGSMQDDIQEGEIVPRWYHLR